LLTEELALRIQKDLLELYQQPQVVKELREMRRAADYEEVRFIRRLRPYLIRLVQPLLHKYGDDGVVMLGEGEEGYKAMEKGMAQHMGTSEEVKRNAKELVGVLMGDLVDMG